MALTRPLGEVYFAYPEESPYAGGPSINLAQSPDAIHWKPLDQRLLSATVRPRYQELPTDSTSRMRLETTNTLSSEQTRATATPTISAASTPMTRKEVPLIFRRLPRGGPAPYSCCWGLPHRPPW